MYTPSEECFLTWSAWGFCTQDEGKLSWVAWCYSADLGDISQMNIKSKVIGAIGVASLAIGAFAGVAQAEDREFGWSWTLTGASDYMFRGISYTGNDPTVNSYLEVTYGIAYAALWTSNIDTGDCDGCLGPWEQDVYIGIRPVTGPVNWDLAVLYYAYGTKGTVSTSDTDYFEFKAAATITPVTNLTVGAVFYYTPDQDLAATENISVEGNIGYTLPAVGIFTPTISGLVGFSDSEPNSFFPTGGYWLGDDSYTYWNAGVKLAIDKFFLDFRYWDTNNETPGNPDSLADERFVFSAGVTFP